MVKKLVVTVAACLLAVPAVAAAAGADLDAARKAVSEMEQASAQVTTLVNDAKASNDAVKFSCLNDKATQIKSYTKDANTTLARAQGLSGAALEAAIREILADAEAVRKLRAEATECVGVAEAEKAQPGAKAKAEEPAFDAIDPLAERNSPLGGSPASSLPAVRSPTEASPTK